MDTETLYLSDGESWLAIGGGDSGGGGITLIDRATVIGEQVITITGNAGIGDLVVALPAITGDNVSEIEIEVSIPMYYLDVDGKPLTYVIDDGTDTIPLAAVMGSGPAWQGQLLASAVVPPYAGAKTWGLYVNGEADLELTHEYVSNASDASVTLSAYLVPPAA